MKKNSGGPAFPEIVFKAIDACETESTVVGRGMTLRQWYAGKALQGLAGNHNKRCISALADMGIAKIAFAFADLMIEFEQKEEK